MANTSLSLSASDVTALAPNWPDALVNDYVSKDADYMTVGSGSPEGVEPSNRTRQYFDADAGKLYVNPDVGSRTGWVAV